MIELPDMFLNVLFATLIILAHVNRRTSPQGANGIRTIAWSLFAMRGTMSRVPTLEGMTINGVLVAEMMTAKGKDASAAKDSNYHGNGPQRE